nr:MULTISPECIES: hypothetical protein [Halomonas]
MALSRYGNIIRLGGEDDRPEYGVLTF